MSERTKPTIILLRGTWWQSLVKDAGSFAMVAGLAVVGVLLDSTALQWIGAIMGFFHIAGNARRMLKRESLTIPEARAKLDELGACQ